MVWATNPFFHKSRPSESDDPEQGRVEPPPQGTDGEEAPVLTQQTSRPSKIQPPSDKWTLHQIFYVFIIDGIGSMILSGGINFAIAYAMYTTQDTRYNPIRLFELPNTLAGDAAVTIIVQCIITWLIELFLVNRDLKVGGVQPIGFIEEPSNRLVRWFMFLDRPEQRVTTGTIAHWVVFLYSQLLRAAIVFFFAFCLLWGPSVGILTAVGERGGGDWYYHKKWAPQIFKLILGGVLGLLTTPPFAMFWLVRCGWAMKKNERHYGEVV